MANSISINSDMTKLILVSNSETSEFDLSGDGVILKLANDDVWADAATNPLPINEVEAATANAQWTATFNDLTKLMFFIGIEDIDTGLVANHQFDLVTKMVNIRRVENVLVVTSSN